MNSECSTSISIELDKRFYFPGETVTGNVYFESTGLSSPSLLNLKLKGKEETIVFDENNKNKSLDSSDSGLIIFYNHVHNLKSWNESLQEGKFIFPFSFLLKDFLPATCLFKENDGQNVIIAKICYKIKIELKSNNLVLSKKTIELTVREKVKLGSLSQAETETYVTSYMCLPAGKLKLNAYFLKNSYESGEEGELVCEIDNSESSINIKNLCCDLKHRIIIRSDDGHIIDKEKLIERKMMEGVQAHKKLENANKRMVNFIFLNSKKEENIELSESSNGQLVNSKYYVEIYADLGRFLSCQSVPHVIFPITIYKKIEGKDKSFLDETWRGKIEEISLIVFSEANFYRKKNKKRIFAKEERKHKNVSETITNKNIEI